jgi:hypothetical protein
MVSPDRLDPVAKASEIVGAAAGVLALVHELRERP